MKRRGQPSLQPFPAHEFRPVSDACGLLQPRELRYFPHQRQENDLNAPWGFPPVARTLSPSRPRKIRPCLPAPPVISSPRGKPPSHFSRCSVGAVLSILPPARSAFQYPTHHRLGFPATRGAEQRLYPDLPRSLQPHGPGRKPRITGARKTGLPPRASSAFSTRAWIDTGPKSTDSERTRIFCLNNHWLFRYITHARNPWTGGRCEPMLAVQPAHRPSSALAFGWSQARNLPVDSRGPAPVLRLRVHMPHTAD